MIKSLLFWAAVAAVAIYLLRTFRPRGAVRIPVIGGMLHAVRAVLGRVWSGLWSRLRGYVATAVERVPGARALAAVPSVIPRPRLPFTRVGSLSPRDQVLYYYLSVVRRAHRHGIDRRGSQTPHEFAAELTPRLAEAGGDMDALTGAFVEARYSRHDLPEAEVSRLRGSWQRVRAALRGARPRPEGRGK